MVQERSLEALLSANADIIEGADTSRRLNRVMRAVDIASGIAFNPFSWVDSRERARVTAVTRLFWMDRPTELTRRLVTQIDQAAPATSRR